MHKIRNQIVQQDIKEKDLERITCVYSTTQLAAPGPLQFDSLSVETLLESFWNMSFDHLWVCPEPVFQTLIEVHLYIQVLDMQPDVIPIAT